MSLCSVVIIFLVTLLIICIFFLVRFSLIILKIEDAIEESLDVIDERYRSISKILEIPLFYDSPQIKQVVSDIKATRETLLSIANRFASIDERAVEEEENEDDANA